MRFACEKCGAQYMIADEKIGDRGVKVKCKKCSHMIIVRPPSHDEPEATQSLADTPDAPTPEGQMGSAFDTMFGNQPAAAAAPAPQGAFDEEPTAAYQSPLGGVGMEAAGGVSSDSGFSSSPDYGAGYGEGFGEPADAGNNGHGVNGDGDSMPAPAGFDSVGGGAFGFEGGTSASGETDFALGTLERQAQEEQSDSAPAERPAGEKEWYVAIEDSQVGPIDIGEVEERWDGRELDEDSLAWKAGMADWMPIAEVPELSYLVTERPQVSVPAAGASFGNTASTLGGGTAAAASSVASASFEAEGPAIDWKPSAASALSSLVEEEVAPAPSVPDPGPAATQPALDGMPSFGANDVFGSTSNGADMSLGAPGPVAPMGDVGGGGWSVPESRRSSGSSPVLLVMVGGMFLLLLGVMGFGAWYFMNQPPAGPTTPSEPEKPITRVAEKDATNDAPDGAKNPADATAAPPEPDKPETKAPTAGKKADGRSKDSKQNKPKGGRDKGRKPKGGKDSMDDVFKKPPPKAASVTTELDKAAIVAGVKANGSKLKPCLTAARSKGEILPGKYKFVLNWRIQPSGGVSGGSLSGPGEVMGTSLPACFSRVMSSWKFKPSKSGAPIKNFPLPINVR